MPKSTMLLLFDSAINTRKTRRPVNSLSRPLSLSLPRTFIFTFKSFWMVADKQLPENSNFTADWQTNQQFCCYSGLISTQEKLGTQQTLPFALSLSLPRTFYFTFEPLWVVADRIMSKKSNFYCIWTQMINKFALIPDIYQRMKNKAASKLSLVISLAFPITFFLNFRPFSMVTDSHFVLKFEFYRILTQTNL